MGVPSSSSDRAEAESKTLVSNAISLLESARRNPEGARQRRFADDKEALSKKALKKQRKEGSQAENMVHATLLSTAGSASSRKAKYARAVAQLEEARRERRNQESLYDRNVQKLSQQSMKVNAKIIDKITRQHLKIPLIEKKEKAEENWSVFAEIDRKAEEKRLRKKKREAGEL
eukprot:m.126482 g.126482  ORF g.126482 m.126482 type:complete len:174 (-) comp17374_c0_seq1:221-742(-)